jgi:hypothetical protein
MAAGENLLGLTVTSTASSLPSWPPEAQLDLHYAQCTSLLSHSSGYELHRAAVAPARQHNWLRHVAKLAGARTSPSTSLFVSSSSRPTARQRPAPVHGVTRRASLSARPNMGFGHQPSAWMLVLGHL